MQVHFPPYGRVSARGRGRAGRSLGVAARIVALGAATLLSAVPAARADVPSSPDRIMRVMSFNIHHGQGTDGALDLGRVAGVIRSQAPEIVGLQEVDRHWSSRSNFADQASELATVLNMHMVYAANLDLDPPAPGQPRRQYGTAVLSRYPILSWDNTLLPRFGDHEQRGLLHAEVMVRGVRVHVYNTHLQHNDAAERLEQARAITEIIGVGERPVVLTGDLNARPGTPEMQEFTGLLTDGWTGDGGFTHPSEQPTARIDYVMTGGVATAERAAVVTDLPVASDHLPVIADVRVPGPPPGPSPAP
jgi:endonuclease/exonuclease/phosphatase family metal-dependent hydrolase